MADTKLGIEGKYYELDLQPSDNGETLILSLSDGTASHEIELTANDADKLFTRLQKLRVHLAPHLK